MAPVVQIEHLRKEFGNVCALDGVSFNVEEGEWIAIMGPSGSGKTTLINILGGLDSPTAGQRGGGWHGCRAPGRSRPYAISRRENRICLPAISPGAVSHGARKRDARAIFPQHHGRKRSARALERVGLGDRLSICPRELSGGEQQRVAVARALINHPKLILADEPTGNLDEANETVVVKLLRELHARAHDPDGHALSHSGQLADRRIDLAHGRLCRSAAISAEDEVQYDHLSRASLDFRRGRRDARARPHAPIGRERCGHGDQALEGTRVAAGEKSGGRAHQRKARTARAISSAAADSPSACSPTLFPSPIQKPIRTPANSNTSSAPNSTRKSARF